MKIYINIEGPPGSGKTFLASVFHKQLLNLSNNMPTSLDDFEWEVTTSLDPSLETVEFRGNNWEGEK